VRSALTRKHLSEVEDELARTKKLLRQYESQSVSPASNPRKRRATSISDHGPPQTHGPSLTQAPPEAHFYNTAPIASDSSLSRPLNLGPPAGNVTQAQAQPYMSSHNHSLTSYPSQPAVMPPAPSQAYQEVDVSQRSISARPNINRGSTSITGPSPTFSLETPPAGDFDWDERVRSGNRFIDGMASLTERSSRGYMGVASGAALLRLADDASADSAVDVDNGESVLQCHGI
jgi:transcriptional regulatory protein GAL4